MGLTPQDIGNFLEIFRDVNNIDNHGEVRQVLLHPVLQPTIAIGECNTLENQFRITLLYLVCQLLKSSFLSGRCAKDPLVGGLWT